MANTKFYSLNHVISPKPKDFCIQRHLESCAQRLLCHVVLSPSIVVSKQCLPCGASRQLKCNNKKKKRLRGNIDITRNIFNGRVKFSCSESGKGQLNLGIDDVSFGFAGR